MHLDDNDVASAQPCPSRVPPKGALASPPPSCKRVPGGRSSCSKTGMWVLVALLLPILSGANSRGVGIPCNVDIAVGSDDVHTKSSAIMWWAAKAKWATAGEYTLRSGDGGVEEVSLCVCTCVCVCACVRAHTRVCRALTRIPVPSSSL